MGEFTEDYYYPDQPQINFTDLTWVTKEGDTILICHLEDEHLLNIVNFLKRNNKIIPYQMELEIVHRKLMKNGGE